ncbi:FliM/FliN family flagellar motor switch protein [Sphingomonas sp. LY54]|uniref:flagellar motor switch protein FliM n=1 Tax=Sphingomonas sp. LY54 TaxID=3095343 RepID=UPI002D78C1A2|nr:FliM/FliN family flagellar motor switch protein [Sphingomonas sp. LY54]WRP28319.1 FliM/FliN family flagellar motor switch protein [Sphingomonas sp. LY54]
MSKKKPSSTAEIVETEAPAAEAGASGGAQAFTFGAESFRPMSALPALDRMSERMARRIRDVIEPFARSKPRVAATPVTVRRFESWREEKAEFTSLSLYRFRPLKGGVLLAVEPECVSQLVDAFYGGSGSGASAHGAEFTATEERLLLRLTEALIATLVEVWSEVMPVTAQLMSRETNTAYATLVNREEPVAVARFTVIPLQGNPTTLDVLYPVSALRAVEDEISAKVRDDAAINSAEWRERLSAALGNVRLDARSVLARPSMPLTDLLKLAPGDIIPITVPANVPLIVAGRAVAHGTIGETDGRPALRIEKMGYRSLT